MISFMEAREKMKERLDPQLWHACAGGMVQIPAVNSRVFYFPQGHAEHASSPVEFRRRRHRHGAILCRVSGVKFLADSDTDEVYARLSLSPGGGDISSCSSVGGETEKPASFAKTLTQSDANNGGGFSVPRYCAETIFPRLDYSADPPVQTILARDVHGETWKFRHIYRGTPRRHLLTTGWSTFVNHKKLVAGDSIVFLRAHNGDLCVGIRRAAKRSGAAELLSSSSAAAWNFPCGGGGGASKVRAGEVEEAAEAAAEGRGFDAVYYPRSGAPEFCVAEGAVRAAAGVRWCPGMRFKMAFETEDSSRVSWFVGTVCGVGPADPARWPDSPWRLLEVAWDEPDLLHNVRRVSPWLVDLVCAPVPPPSAILPLTRKKPRLLFDEPSAYTPPMITTTSPAGMQGARHALHHHHRYALSFSNLIPAGPSPFDWKPLPRPPLPNPKPPATQLVLFGRPILTEQQISLGCCSASDPDPDQSKNAHCKVFMESEDVGRSLDLSLLASYDELYAKLADMFGIHNSQALGRALYRDGSGAARHIGDQPFSDFTKTARRLTILMDSSGDTA